VEEDVAHQPLLGARKLVRMIALSYGIKNITGRFFGLITKHACDRHRQTDERTDGQTDGQNYDSQDRASIASRGKNVTFFMVHCVYSSRLCGLLQSCVYKQQCCFDFVAVACGHGFRDLLPTGVT